MYDDYDDYDYDGYKPWWKKGKSGGSGYSSTWSSGWGTKSVSLFETELIETTSILGRDKAVSVSFSGTSFVLDRAAGTVTFPKLDSMTELSNETQLFFRGIVDHESARLRFSERAVYNGVLRRHAEKDALLVNLFDAIESVRVEQEYIDIYPGAKKNLVEFADQTTETQLGEWEKLSSPTEPDPVTGKVPDPVEIKFHEKVPLALSVSGRKANDYFCWRGSEFLRKDFSEEEAEKILEWRDRLLDCTSTTDSYELAKEIYESLGSPQIEDRSPKQAMGEGGGKGQDDGTGSINFSGASKLEAMSAAKIAKFIEDNITKKKCFAGFGGGGDLPIHHWKTSEVMRHVHSLSDYIDIKNSISSTVSVARRKLELLIQAKRRTDWEYMKEQGKLDSKRLVQAYDGHAEVFKTKQDETDLETVVSVMVDLSGSMDGYPRRVASQMGIALGECLQKIGVPYEISGFSSAHGGRSHGVFIFKAFSDRPFDARSYLAGLGGVINRAKLGGGGTPTGEALVKISDRIFRRPEKRRIIFVITDGGANDTDYINRAIKLSVKRGIEVIGIGIGHENMRDILVGSGFKSFSICEKVEDLPVKVLGELEKALLHSEAISTKKK